MSFHYFEFYKGSYIQDKLFEGFLKFLKVFLLRFECNGGFLQVGKRLRALFSTFGRGFDPKTQNFYDFSSQKRCILRKKSTFWPQKVKIRVTLGFLLAGNRLRAIFATVWITWPENLDYWLGVLTLQLKIFTIFRYKNVTF